MLDEKKKQDRLAHLKSVARHKKPAAIPTSFSRSTEETVHFTLQINDVQPLSPSQFVEYTLTPRMERRKRKESLQLEEVTMHYDMQTFGDSIKLIHRHETSGSRLLSGEMIPDEEQTQASARYSESSVRTSYKVTSDVSTEKYSHIERMAIIRKLYR